MKSFLKLILCSTLFLTSLGLAKQKSSLPEDESSNRYFGSSRHESALRVPLSLGIPVIYQASGVAFHGGMDFKISPELPLFLGFETGFDILGSRYYYDGYYITPYSAFLSMPLLLSAVYRFELPRVPSLHPYAGAAIGPYLILTQGTAVTVEFVVRPGISWSFAKKMDLHGEMRFGVMGSSFVVQPTAGITFVM